MISHGAIVWGEAEQEAAERFRAYYGIDRGYTLACVLRVCSKGPMAAYYRTIAHILGQFIAPRENLFEKLATTATLASKARVDLKRDPEVDRRIQAQVAALRASRASKPKRQASAPRSARKPRSPQRVP